MKRICRGELVKPQANIVRGKGYASSDTAGREKRRGGKKGGQRGQGGHKLAE